MLKRINRLSTKRDIAAVFSKGRVVHGRGFVVRIGQNNLGLSRFAFVVSTKISKKAVERNKIRRRAREAVRLTFDRLRTGNDVIIIAKAQSRDMDFGAVSADLVQVLTKAKLLEG